MKKIVSSLLAMGLAVGLLAYVCWAQDSGAGTAGPARRARGPGAGSQPGRMGADLGALPNTIRQLRALKLTPEQTAKVKTILDEARKNITENVLTAEQRTQLSQMPTSGPGRFGPGAGGPGGGDGTTSPAGPRRGGRGGPGGPGGAPPAGGLQ